MFKKVYQQGRSEREAEAYRGPVAGAPIAVLAMGRDATGERYVEAWSETRTQLEAFFNILLRAGDGDSRRRPLGLQAGCRVTEARSGP